MWTLKKNLCTFIIQDMCYLNSWENCCGWFDE
jgi:hypothetical protein